MKQHFQEIRGKKNMTEGFLFSAKLSYKYQDYK